MYLCTTYLTVDLRSKENIHKIGLVSLKTAITFQMESDVTAFVDHYQDCMNAWRKHLLKDSTDKIRRKNTAPLDVGRNLKVGGKADALARRREVTQPLRVKCYHDVAKSPQFKSEDVNEKDIELERGWLSTSSIVCFKSFNV